MADLTDLLEIPTVNAFLKSRAEREAREEMKRMERFKDSLEVLGDDDLFTAYVASLEQRRPEIYDRYLAQLRGEDRDKPDHQKRGSGDRRYR